MNQIRRAVRTTAALSVLLLGTTYSGVSSGIMPFDSRMPVGDLPGLKQVVAEQFNTVLPLGGWANSTYYKSKFRAYGPSNLLRSGASWTDSSKHGRYMPQIMEANTASTPGFLRSHLHTDPVSGKPFVSALVPKRSDNASSSFMYGRFSVKARFPHFGTGGYYKVAWLLWPDNGLYKLDGEIDFPEIDLWTDLLRGFMHYTDQVAGQPTYQAVYKQTPFDFTQWHVYTIDWSPQLVTFTLDGTEVKRVTGARIPHVPMHWVMQNETGISHPTPSPTAKGDVDTAWVAAWAYAP